MEKEKRKRRREEGFSREGVKRHRDHRMVISVGTKRKIVRMKKERGRRRGVGRRNGKEK